MTQTVRALGFALFVSAMGYLGWWWLQLPNAPDAPLWPAALLDTMLFSAFAVHHSVLARPFSARCRQAWCAPRTCGWPASCS